MLCNRVGRGRKNPFNEQKTQAQMRYDCNLKAVRAGERRGGGEMFNFRPNWCRSLHDSLRNFILFRLTASRALLAISCNRN